MPMKSDSHLISAQQFLGFCIDVTSPHLRNFQYPLYSTLCSLIKQQLNMTSDVDYFKKYLYPANPIITKKVHQTSQGLTFKSLPKYQEINNKFHSQTYQKELEESSSDSQIQGETTLKNHYSKKTLVYCRSDNTEVSKRNRKEYYASIFTNFHEWPLTEPYHASNTDLKFISQKQSMNLFAVHQIGKNEYDLILMNDINTSGYTQWFYFTVLNKSKNQSVKFNIMNLYKNKSLYQNGMKPLLSITKKNAIKQWQRGCSNVKYYENDISFEYGKKFYKTLSFQHTFLQQNGETSFAHFFPYTHHELKQKIKLLETNPRVKIRTIGTTALKKNIQILEVFKQQNVQNKRAIIIMARQHPGESVGSIIAEQMINGILRPSQQNQFLLWKFSFFFIPMVNIDGVCLGNYRANAFGYDLNRCWDRQNPIKLPEIVAIKKQIRRIQKKMPIELVLDLHGHSRKMGSFFFGNPFGKNTGLLPYIASKNNSNVSFENSTFHKQKSQKVSTARVVLGNMFKDTGCFYTYETSFYGGVTNGKNFHFNLEIIKQLGDNLIVSVFKTYMELHKEEKTLKQSLFLREVRKQIKDRGKNNDVSSCSDSEAAQITIKEFKAKQQTISSQLARPQIKKIQTQIKKKQLVSIQIQVDCETTKQRKLRNLLENKSITKAHSKQFLRQNQHQQDYSLHVGFQKNPEQMQYRELNPVARKKFLLQKLRVFGETFIQPNPRDKNKQTQTESYGAIEIIGNNKKRLEMDNQVKPAPYRKKKNRNRSLILKIGNKDKLGIQDIVKVNKLEYKKIKREDKLPFLN